MASNLTTLYDVITDMSDNDVTAPNPPKRDDKWLNSMDPLAPPLEANIIYKMIGCFGVLGNLAVIYVMMSSKRLRNKPINMFIIHQSLVDMLGCIAINCRIIINNMTWTKTLSPVMQRYFCKLWMPYMIHIAFYGMSGYNLVALSIERYLAIIKPLQYDEEKVKKRLPWIFLFVWVFPIVVHIPYPFTIELLHGTCFLLYHVRTVQHRVLLLLSRWLFLSIIPSVLIVVLYTRMGLAMKFDFKAGSTATSEKEGSKSKLKLTKAQASIFSTCLLMVGAFLLCWGCYMGSIIAAAVKKGMITDSLSEVFVVADLMLEVNSAVNPIIYAFRYNDFQNQVKALIYGEEKFKNSTSFKSSSTNKA